MGKISVIVPVRNGGEDFHICLEALRTSTRQPDELIVVDDSSTDQSAELARSVGAQVLSLSGGPFGPAAARNRGADVAHGDFLIFIDADVTVHSDTLAKIDYHLDTFPEIAALFGSYDERPPKQGLVTRYKNLQHYFVHQNSQREASTFWAGCGAVRRTVFVDLGGFNEHYLRPAIEDIELGVRMHKAGYRIWLCPDIQVTHLKRWTLKSLFRSDIFDRAIPWTRLILTTDRLPADLNLDHKSRLSALAAWAWTGLLLVGFWTPWAWLGMLLVIAFQLGLNTDFYRFLKSQGGLAFAAGGFVLHTFYFLYSSFIFGVLFLHHLLDNTIFGRLRQNFIHHTGQGA